MFCVIEHCINTIRIPRTASEGVIMIRVPVGVRWGRSELIDIHPLCPVRIRKIWCNRANFVLPIWCGRISCVKSGIWSKRKFVISARIVTIVNQLTILTAIIRAVLSKERGRIRIENDAVDIRKNTDIHVLYLLDCRLKVSSGKKVVRVVSVK